MHTKRPIYVLTIILLLLISLAACGGSEATSSPVPATKEMVEPEPQAATVMAEDTAQNAASDMRIFVIVPAESKASYLADEEFFENALSKYGIEAGNNDVVGSTQVIEGQLQINPNDMTQLLGENNFKVDMRTLKTDQDRRDNYILDNGPAFNRFPEATFSATEISGLPEVYVEGEEIQFQMNGILTVHKVPVPVTFDVSARLAGDTMTGVAETRTLMSAFGIEPPDFVRTLTVADEFGIRVEFTAKEK